MSFPNLRLRRLRKTGKIRELLEEVRLSPRDLICPIFVQEDLKSRIQGSSMPGMERLPLADVVTEVHSIAELKIPAVMVFEYLRIKTNMVHLLLLKMELYKKQFLK